MPRRELGFDDWPDYVAADDLHKRLPEYSDEAIRRLGDADLARLFITVRRNVADRSVNYLVEGERCERCGVTVSPPGHSCCITRRNYVVLSGTALPVAAR